MDRIIEFVPLLTLIQEHISTNYAAALTDSDKQKQLIPIINKFLYDTGYSVRGMNKDDLAKKLYSEMAEYAVITPFLNRDDVEEINVNAWNNIVITYTDGRMEHLPEHFYSPQNAEDIIKRLLHLSGEIIDAAKPHAQGHLPGNTRITAMIPPIVDKEIGVCASIRRLHPSSVTREKIIVQGTATEKMVMFLETCLRYGVAMVVAGVTSSGKTTVLNALLNSIPNDKRIYTIETGARELSLVKTDEEGNVVNNVVHTLARHSDNELYDVTQEKLVELSLRFDPDLIVVGEMRDREAADTVEASLTGHTVASTVHATAGPLAHNRIALLCKRKQDVDLNTLLIQTAQAFPIVVYAHKLEDNSRRLMDISECEVTADGKRIYHCLYRYCITKNELHNGMYVIEGHFEQPELMSESLQRKLMQYGIPQDKLQIFLEKGAD